MVTERGVVASDERSAVRSDGAAARAHSVGLDGGARLPLASTPWSSPCELDTWFMRLCDGTSCPRIRLVADVRSWSEAGGGCTTLRSSIGLIAGPGAGCGSRPG